MPKKMQLSHKNTCLDMFGICLVRKIDPRAREEKDEKHAKALQAQL